MSNKIDLSFEDCGHIFDNYFLGFIKAITPITEGYNNANFKVTTNLGDFLLKIYLENKLPDIEYEIKLLAKLKKEGFPCAYPIASTLGDYITWSEFGDVVVYTFLHGKKPEINPQSVKLAARNLGRLNSIKATADIEKENSIGWRWCLSFADYLAKTTNDYLLFTQYFVNQTAFFADVMSKSLPKGIIHGDIFTDNTILLEDGELAFIDFEAAATDVFLIDIGVAINGFCFQNDKLDFDLLKIFLREYNQVRPLSKEEVDLLSYYIIWGIHTIIGWHIKILIERKERNDRQIKRVEYLINRVEALVENQSQIDQEVSLALNLSK